MSMNKKAKKKLIITSITVTLLAAFAVGLWFFVQYQNNKKTVEVIPVMQISTQYWGDQTSSSGMIVSDYVQEIYPAAEKVVSDIFVQQDQEVHIGDPLLQYDKEKLQLDVEAKEVALKEADLKIDTAQKQLKKLQNTKPVSTAKPTIKPTSRPTNKPTVKPTASASPTVTPVPSADVTLYSRLDLDSKPYAGSGTTEDPYLFLCTDDCIMTPEFLSWLLGAGAESEPTPTPTPSPVPDEDGDEDGEGEETPPSQPESTPEPTPTPRPESDLASPFAAVFEVRDGNSNYGQLISAFKLDGTQLSASFQHSSVLTGSNTLDSVAGLFGATPTPTANPNNYDSMGYTSSELQKLITEKKQEIRDLQHARKQAQLDLDRSNLTLKNSTVLSNVDGTVKTLIDQEAAAAENKPFLVISGDDKYYVAGALSENLLGSVQVGDSVSVMDYMTGNSYPAQIVGIADYPLDASSGLYSYGSGNPNSSSYEFTAVIEQGDGLQNGLNVEITMDVQEQADTEALYVYKAYLRDDDAGTYVMKAGIDNRLIKQYLQIGKSIYSGEYIEIKSGLTIDDYVAFPYGADVKEGVRVIVQGTEEGPMSGGESSAPAESGNAESGNAESGGLFDGEDMEGEAGTSSAEGESSVPDGDAPAAQEAVPEGGVIVGSDEGGTYFKTENGGGVMLS